MVTYLTGTQSENRRPKYHHGAFRLRQLSVRNQARCSYRHLNGTDTCIRFANTFSNLLHKCHTSLHLKANLSIDKQYASINNFIFPPNLLTGVLMSTRSGDIDPSCVLRCREILPANEQTDADLERFLNQECGFKGMCGVSDFQEVEERMKRRKHQ